MNKPNALLIAAVFLTPFAYVVDTRADEANQVTEMYMPNDSDGFLTLTSEECQIPGIKDTYPYKALNADDQGHEMEGCWVRPDAPEPFEPLVSVWMYELGSANIGTFKQHLFSAEKKRWSDPGTAIVKNTF